MYAAAGAVTGSSSGVQPIRLRQRLAVICSTLDRDWVDEVRDRLPVEELPVETPPGIEHAAVQVLGNTRDQQTQLYPRPSRHGVQQSQRSSCR